MVVVAVCIFFLYGEFVVLWTFVDGVVVKYHTHSPLVCPAGMVVVRWLTMSSVSVSMSSKVTVTLVSTSEFRLTVYSTVPVVFVDGDRSVNADLWTVVQRLGLGQLEFAIGGAIVVDGGGDTLGGFTVAITLPSASLPSCTVSL